MKKALILLLLSWNCYHVQAQNPLAKQKYQEAEKAFHKGNYSESIGLLDETEKLLGQAAPNTLQLRIMAEAKIWESNPTHYQQFEKLRNDCKLYLEKHDTAGLSEVSDLLKKLPNVSNQEELTFYVKNQQEQSKSSKFEQAIAKHNMALVKGGTYTMGARSEAHEVTVDDFYIGKYEITVKDWNNYLEATGKKGNKNNELIQLLELYFQVEGLANSVTGILNTATGGKAGLLSNKSALAKRIPQQDNSAFSRFLPARAHKKKSLAYFNQTLYPEILAYCKWLEQQYGGIWRLPTEAEWEYAARNGSTEEHISSEGKNSSTGRNEKYKMYYDDTVPYIELPHAFSNDVVVEKAVGRKKPNALGLYDMIGNVSELCYDYFDSNYYKYSPKTNPMGPEQGEYKSIRGNHIFWANGGLLRDGDVNAIGFRVVYIPD